MELAVDYAVKALYLVMMLSLPPIVVALSLIHISEPTRL